LIVTQFNVYRPNQVDAISQGRIYRVGCLAVEIAELIETTNPMAFATEAALAASIIGCLEQTFMWAVSLINNPKHEFSWKVERFDQFSPHNRLLILPSSNLVTAQFPVYRVFRVCGSIAAFIPATTSAALFRPCFRIGIMFRQPNLENRPEHAQRDYREQWKEIGRHHPCVHSSGCTE
jgi:hypothetical protein